MVPAKKSEPNEKPLTSVMEDYLETIFDLDKNKKVVRVKDIARKMDVKMPTVTSMLKTLSQRGLVHYEKYEYVELTKDGADVGREMRRRHEILKKFLIDILRIDAKTADDEACKMEHTLSPQTLESFVDFMEFIQVCPRAGDNWLEHFQHYRIHGHDPEKCKEQVEHFQCDFKDKMNSMENDN